MGWDRPPQPCDGCGADLDGRPEIWVQTGIGLICQHGHEDCAANLVDRLKAEWGSAKRVPRPVTKDERAQRKADDRSEYEELGRLAPE